MAIIYQDDFSKPNVHWQAYDHFGNGMIRTYTPTLSITPVDPYSGNSGGAIYRDNEADIANQSVFFRVDSVNLNPGSNSTFEVNLCSQSPVIWYPNDAVTVQFSANSVAVINQGSEWLGASSLTLGAGMIIEIRITGANVKVLANGITVFDGTFSSYVPQPGKSAFYMKNNFGHAAYVGLSHVAYGNDPGNDVYPFTPDILLGLKKIYTEDMQTNTLENWHTYGTGYYKDENGIAIGSGYYYSTPLVSNINKRNYYVEAQILWPQGNYSGLFLWTKVGEYGNLQKATGYRFQFMRSDYSGNTLSISYVGDPFNNEGGDGLAYVNIYDNDTTPVIGISCNGATMDVSFNSILVASVAIDSARVGSVFAGGQPMNGSDGSKLLSFEVFEKAIKKNKKIVPVDVLDGI